MHTSHHHTTTTTITHSTDLMLFTLIADVSILTLNLSLMLNTVSFYTITKIAVAPMVLVLEFVLLGHRVTLRVVASVAVVCIGVAICTVTDTQVRASN